MAAIEPGLILAIVLVSTINGNGLKLGLGSTAQDKA